MDYSKLTYAVQKKTEKICELKVKKAKWKFICILATGINLLLIAYILLYNRFTYTTTSIFANKNLVHAVKPSDFIILIVFAVAVIIIFCSVFQYMELQENYEQIRRELKENINYKICTCKGDCVCNHEYIKDMMVKGIGLITS